MVGKTNRIQFSSREKSSSLVLNFLPSPVFGEFQFKTLAKMWSATSIKFKKEKKNTENGDEGAKKMEQLRINAFFIPSKFLAYSEGFKVCLSIN